MDAIILAGGLGTRLRGVVSDVPKPLAPINGKPFLEILLRTLEAKGFERATIALGYRGHAIQSYFGHRFGALALNYSVETEPLGTGGAIRLALPQTNSTDVFVLNGDTYAALDFTEMLAAHRQDGASLTVAVKWVSDAARYGALDLAGQHILGFFEKARVGAGYINAGTYIVSRSLLGRDELPLAFSFEADFLKPHIRSLRPLAFEARGTFIDIGIPEDYARAQTILDPVIGKLIELG